MYVLCKRITLSLIAVVVIVSGSFFTAHADTSDVTVTVTFFECNDGIDNDGDGDIDHPDDPGCSSPTDNDETNPQCNDDIDNDGDGDIDFPNDLGCDSLTDDDESGEVVDESTISSGSAGGGRVADVTFYGLAHPHSDVFLLRDGFLVASTEADSDATFRVGISDVTTGSYLFTLYAIDTEGVRSGVLSFTLDVPESSFVRVEDIFIPPTIRFTQNSSLFGEGVLVEGHTVPNATVAVVVLENNQELYQADVIAGSEGRYTASFSSVTIATESVIKSFAAAAGLTSPFGRAAAAFDPTGAGEIPGDINGDRRVDLVDFSILGFWYKRTNPPEHMDMNGDGVVDLADVSVLVFYWTG